MFEWALGHNQHGRWWMRTDRLGHVADCAGYHHWWVRAAADEFGSRLWLDTSRRQNSIKQESRLSSKSDWILSYRRIVTILHTRPCLEVLDHLTAFCFFSFPKFFFIWRAFSWLWLSLFHRRTYALSPAQAALDKDQPRSGWTRRVSGQLHDSNVKVKQLIERFP